MKIAFVAPRFHTNQVPFVRALLAAGHEVTMDVLSVGKSEDHTLLRPNVMPISRRQLVRMQRRSPVNEMSYLADHAHPSIAWYLRRLRDVAPDVVVIRDPNRPYAWRATAAARMLGLRTVLYTQGRVHGRPTVRSRWLRSAALRVFDAIWFSPVPGDVSQPRIHRDFHYLPFAADLDRQRKTTWFAQDRVNVLCIGKFTARKNHRLLLDAFNVVRHMDRVHLTLVGEVSTAEHQVHHKEIIGALEEDGLTGDVSVRTNVAFRDIGALYVEHDLFVLPSRNEPIGVSVLEAMTHGLPVICSTTNGAQWYLAEGENGFVFRSDDREDLIRVLSRVLVDRSALVSMGARSRTLAETVHHPDTVVTGFVRLLERWRQ